MGRGAIGAEIVGAEDVGAGDVEFGAVGAGAAAAARLAAARAALRRGEDRVVDRAPAPEPGADGRVLPVVAPLAGLLPAGGLRRGSTVAVAAGTGSTSLLTALIARASAAGAWVGVVGRPELGLVAAAEAGVALERLALVPYPGADLVAVTAALLDGLDVVAVAVPGSGLRAGERQRLAARARQRGAVLLPLGSWPGADAELRCAPTRWQGAGGRAEGVLGRLCARRVQVRLRGRGVVPAGRAAALLLPGPAGTPEAAPAGVAGAGSAGAGSEVAGSVHADREAG
jgi:hypothetical protein